MREGSCPPDSLRHVRFEHQPAQGSGTAVSTNLGQPGRQGNKYWSWTMAWDWEVPTLALLGDAELKGISFYQTVDLFSDGDRDATGENETTAEDIGGIALAVTGAIQPAALECVRNIQTTPPE